MSEEVFGLDLSGWRLLGNLDVTAHASPAWEAVLADLPDATVTISGEWESVGSPDSIPFRACWNPEDREYTQTDADAMVGKDMRFDVDEGPAFAGAVTAAEVEDGGRALWLTGWVMPE